MSKKESKLRNEFGKLQDLSGCSEGCALIIKDIPNFFSKRFVEPLYREPDYRDVSIPNSAFFNNAKIKIHSDNYIETKYKKISIAKNIKGIFHIIYIAYKKGWKKGEVLRYWKDLHINYFKVEGICNLSYSNFINTSV